MLLVRVCLLVINVFFAIQFVVCLNEYYIDKHGLEYTPMSSRENDMDMALCDTFAKKFREDGITNFNCDKLIFKGPNSTYGYILDIISDNPSFIGTYRGLSWCGDPEIAKKENSIHVKQIEKCCKEHDNCESIIEPDSVLANLKNNGVFRRSTCSCERKFYNCLGKSSSRVALKIGIMYFKILDLPCFQCECSTYDSKSRNNKKCCSWHDNMQMKYIGGQYKF